MYSARREGRELGQLREAACLMYEARRGEERCTSVWGTGATQGAPTSPHPSLRPPTGADRPLAALLGKTTARGRSAPPPAPRCPEWLPPHHPQPNLRSASVAACGAGCVFLPRTVTTNFRVRCDTVSVRGRAHKTPRVENHERCCVACVRPPTLQFPALAALSK